MKYMLLIHLNPTVFDALSQEERDAVMNGHEGFQAEIKKTGEFVSTLALGGQSDSSVVRVRDGVPAVTDGPYVEAKEFLAGYYIVDCETRDRAHELASKMPEAKVFPLEVRPVVYTQGAEV